MDETSKEKIKEAQLRLDELCEEYGVNPFSVNRRQGGDWKKLVQSMCGLAPPEPKKSGRKKKYTEEEILKVGQLLDIMRSFGVLDDEGNEIEPPLMVKQTYKEGMKLIDDEVTEEAIRGLWNKYKALQKKRIEELSLEPHDDF